MTATATSTLPGNSVEIGSTDSSNSAPRMTAIRPYDPSSSSPNEISQIRHLFVSGMKSNSAPEEYICRSLSSDIKDGDSMMETYFTGRGTFLLMEGQGSDAGSTDSDANNDRENEIVGMVGLQDVSPTTGANRHGGKVVETRNICELRRMSIHSSYRRCGLGAKLIEACISHAKAKDFCGIKLYTGGWMDAAINFYRKMGFEDKGRIDYTNANGETVTIAHLEMMF